MQGSGRMLVNLNRSLHEVNFDFLSKSPTALFEVEKFWLGDTNYPILIAHSEVGCRFFLSLLFSLHTVHPVDFSDSLISLFLHPGLFGSISLFFILGYPIHCLFG